MVFSFAVVLQLSEYITSFGYAVNFPHSGIVVRISASTMYFLLLKKIGDKLYFKTCTPFTF